MMHHACEGIVTESIHIHAVIDHFSFLPITEVVAIIYVRVEATSLIDIPYE